MPRTTKFCKVCGKEYEACRTPNPGIFRWRDVACSMECAQKYLHDVMVARGEIVEDHPETRDEVDSETRVTTDAQDMDVADAGTQDEPDADATEMEDVGVFAAADAQTVRARHGRSRKK